MNARAKAIANLYRRNKITKDGLKKAVDDGIITKEQYQEITGQAY
jgi:hypothetical protein